MRSVPYFLGLFFGDYVIFTIPQIVLVGFYYLSSDTIADKSLQLFGALMLFGAPFISINYVSGYFFKTADTAFRYNTILMIAIYVLPFLLGAIATWINLVKDPNTVIDVVVYVSPPALLFQTIQGIMNVDPTTG